MGKVASGRAFNVKTNQIKHVDHKEDLLLYDPHAVLDRLRPGLTTTASVAIGQQGAYWKLLPLANSNSGKGEEGGVFGGSKRE